MAKKFDIDSEISGWIKTIDEMGEDLDKENKCLDEKGIYRQALKKWGSELQIIMVFEEMAELQKELSKKLRGKDNIENIADEIADVEIMIGQMKLLFGIEEEVEKHKKLKLQRLEERLRQ